MAPGVPASLVKHDHGKLLVLLAHPASLMGPAMGGGTSTASLVAADWIDLSDWLYALRWVNGDDGPSPGRGVTVVHLRGPLLAWTLPDDIPSAAGGPAWAFRLDPVNLPAHDVSLPPIAVSGPGTSLLIVCGLVLMALAFRRVSS